MKANMSILEALLDMLQQKMIDPSSHYYLPVLVQQLNNPSINPYVINDDWNMSGLSGDSIVTGANQICLQATPDKYYPAQGIYASMPQITLSSIQINGLINVLPEKPTVVDPDSDAPKISVVLDFCTIMGTSLPTSITIAGNFTLNQSCCVPARGAQTCEPTYPKFSTDGDGTFTATLSPVTGPTQTNQLKMTCNAVITVQPDNSFLVTVTDIDVNIPTEALSISVVINSTGKGDKKTYEKLAEEALNSDGAKSQILTQMQSEASSEATRDEIGKMITNQLNNLMLQGVL